MTIFVYVHLRKFVPVGEYSAIIHSCNSARNNGKIRKTFYLFINNCFQQTNLLSNVEPYTYRRIDQFIGQVAEI